MVEASTSSKRDISYTLLPDPLGDRKLKDSECKILSNTPLDDSKLWLDDKPDWKMLKEFLCREGPISKPQTVRLLKSSLELFKKEPNLCQLDEPICVVGDIHGQYSDLLNLFKAGEPGTLNYLFLGDYVDRGIFGIEVCLLLFAIKLNCPKSVVLLRGNHESRNMTESFTFREEVLSRYDQEVYDLFMEVFDALPIAALVAQKYLAMHGGIAKDLTKIDQINQIDRFTEIPLEGAFCDLMWADPMDDDEAVNGNFKDNPDRECSIYFGKRPVKALLKRNKLLSVFRGHQVKQDGFCMHKWGSKDSFPYVITIFSAPNYCGSYKNKASVLILENNNL